MLNIVFGVIVVMLDRVVLIIYDQDFLFGFSMNLVALKRFFSLYNVSHLSVTSCLFRIDTDLATINVLIFLKLLNKDLCLQLDLLSFWVQAITGQYLFRLFFAHAKSIVYCAMTYHPRLY